MRIRLLVGLLALAASLSAQVPSFEGRPVFPANNDVGYYLWRHGGVWHLRWVSLIRARRFQGTVTVNEGTVRLLDKIDVSAEMAELYPTHQKKLPFTIVRPSPGEIAAMEMSNRARNVVRKKGDSTITFDSDPDDSLEGIDFTVSDRAASIWLELKFEGKPRADLVHIGSAGVQPEEVPFIIPLR